MPNLVSFISFVKIQGAESFYWLKVSSVRNSFDNKLLSNFKLSPERNCNSQKSFQLNSRLKFSAEEINWRRIFSRRIFFNLQESLRLQLFSADSNFEASKFSNRREKYSKLEINLLQLTKVKVENCNRHKLFVPTQTFLSWKLANYPRRQLLRKTFRSDTNFQTIFKNFQIYECADIE